MTYVRNILCLAKSWKHHGHCIAGRTYSSTTYLEWVRPVSARPDEEISDLECSYAAGEANVLDIIELSLVQTAPQLHQVENHVIDPAVRWKKIGQGTWQHVQHALQTPTTLWQNGDSSYNGTNDRIAQALLQQQGSSLYLIRPENARVIVGNEGPPGHERRKARAVFEYRGATYALGITDPVANSTFKQNVDGTYALTSEMIFCVSLGTILNGFAYKLVAGVFTPTRTRDGL